MERNSFAECERRGLNKFINFRLPHSFYKLGMIIVGASIVMMFVRAFALEGDYDILKEVLKKVLLIGMLLMSIAKDKVEDELIVKLRLQSYTYAFVTGVIYALVMPYVDFGVSNIVHGGGEVYKDLGDFQVLIFMLLVQLLCFTALKRSR
ncbi:hypothetical protein SAMN04515667_1479 [Formosa sp. Hel1_31_208]|uniref:hypothetical protein n=1 Tax=Formosa sp. Hel1_31_208 TaxID=1798225 RepID=UPI00087A020F|nr:hypothetical protein [Formosa sp. Hel1_31_208]SDS13055.1 hypothetical protein SAMN04515667_1479 [Formosa sp. Hel1_31_208]